VRSRSERRRFKRRIAHHPPKLSNKFNPHRREDKGVNLELQQACRAELRRMTSRPSSRKQIAYELGRSQVSLSRYIRGKSPIPDGLAVQILAKVRIEDLLLADRIEDELHAGSPFREAE
jgi:hypothetical protein